MKISLKAQNQPLLAAVVALNLAAAYGVILPTSVDLSQILLLSSQQLANSVPVAVVLVTFVLNALLSSDTKARLIYFATDNPYPASTAFTELGPRDWRVDMTCLGVEYAPLPTSPRQQNGLWYRLLRKHSTEPAVKRSHKEFLFFRDYAVLSFFFLGFLSPWACLYRHPDAVGFAYVVFLLLQFGLTLIAAQQAGRRLVTNVLAVASNPNDH